MENNWIENVTGICPVEQGTVIDVTYRDSEILTGIIAGNYNWKFYGEFDDIVHWRLHKPKQQSLDNALGNISNKNKLEYPKTPFKPSSEAQLRSDEAARVNALLSEKLSTIADIASKLTRKNFSVADIKLVKDLLESVKEYEENR